MSAKLKYVDPNRRRGWFSRAYAALANTRLGRFMSVHLVWKVDPYLMRATGGRLGMGLVMPTALLETRGAKSGALRRNVVIYFHDGDRVTIVASKLGFPQTPGVVPQPPGPPRRHLRWRPDAGDGGRRRGRAPEALDARRSCLRALRGLPTGSGEGEPDDPDRPAHRARVGLGRGFEILSCAVAGVGSSLPAASTAITASVCLPGSRPR